MVSRPNVGTWRKLWLVKTVNATLLQRDRPGIEDLNYIFTHCVENPEEVQNHISFETKLNVVHEINSLKLRRVEAELSMIGVLEESRSRIREQKREANPPELEPTSHFPICYAPLCN